MANLHGFAGLKEQRVSRITGRLYSIYVATEAGMDQDGGKYITVCETHNTLCNHTTLKMAQYHLPTGDWCEECQKERGE